MGHCLEFGVSVDRHVREADKYYKHASDHGDYAGPNRLGLCVEFRKALAAYLVQAAEFSRIEADSGHPPAQTNDGFFLEHGFDIDIDLAEAARYYKLSAGQNYSDGPWHCAHCYHDGIGVNADFETAALYYEKAASGSPKQVRNRNSFRCLWSLRQAELVQRSIWEQDTPHSVPHSWRYFIVHGGSSSVYLIDDPNGREKLAIKEFCPVSFK